MNPVLRLWWRAVRALGEIATGEGARWARIAERRLKDLDAGPDAPSSSRSASSSKRGSDRP